MKKDDIVEISDEDGSTKCVILYVKNDGSIRVHSLDPKNPFRTTLHKSCGEWEEYAIGNVSGTNAYSVRRIDDATGS